MQVQQEQQAPLAMLAQTVLLALQEQPERQEPQARLVQPEILEQSVKSEAASRKEAIVAIAVTKVGSDNPEVQSTSDALNRVLW